MKLSDGEKLIILMLSELYEKLGVEGEIEPDFIKSAIFGNQLWGLKWKYSGIPFEESEDGISFTFAITPSTLGQDMWTKETNLVSMLDGYFAETGHHINVNVFDRALLEDAMEHPEKYPQLTIRVSGYAVNFTKLTREQQLDVINRTIHERI